MEEWETRGCARPEPFSEIMMRTSRARRIGCIIVLLVVVASAVLLVRWVTAPIDIPRPQRPPEPADNPYDVYRSLAVYTAQIFRSDPLLPNAEQLLASSRHGVYLENPELARYLLRAVQSVRQEYRRYLDKPCVVIMEYTSTWQFPELVEFRHWANIESLGIALAVQTKDYAQAIDCYRTILLLAEQIRNHGGLAHYFTGSSMQSVVTTRMSKALGLLPLEPCEQLVRVVREWQKKHVPLIQVLSTQRDMFLVTLHDLYAGNYEVFRMHAEYRSAIRWNPRWFNLRRAAHEGVTFFRKLEKEWAKPLNQQRDVEEPEHPIARLLLPGFGRMAYATSTLEARIRLLGCAAAVRAYRLRHGSYPATLDEAGVSDINKDPFTGGRFVYKPAKQGFLLYSVGADGKDDGGWRAPERAEGGGDISLLPFMGRSRIAGGGAEKGEPVWLE